ncbi:hypothetical protein COBT_003649 [Conglomerata obtusa]
MLGGNDIIVEGDESLFGRRTYNRGRQRNQTWVIGFVEKTVAQKVFFCTIKKRNKKSILILLIKKFAINQLYILMNGEVIVMHVCMLNSTKQ